ncbi:MAG: hypothetical protein VKK59_08080 [Vampirovibrionales bacterium]|nr:hypothetical protein [Vampirovibrionales bacterium]
MGFGLVSPHFCNRIAIKEFIESLTGALFSMRFQPVLNLNMSPALKRAQISPHFGNAHLELQDQKFEAHHKGERISISGKFIRVFNQNEKTPSISIPFFEASGIQNLPLETVIAATMPGDLKVQRSLYLLNSTKPDHQSLISQVKRSFETEKPVVWHSGNLIIHPSYIHLQTFQELEELYRIKTKPISKVYFSHLLGKLREQEGNLILDIAAEPCPDWPRDKKPNPPSSSLLYPRLADVIK